MNLIELGKTKLKVSRIGVGTGTAGFARQSQQSKISPAVYGSILKKAFELGINFWDTSDDYGTYEHIKKGLEGLDRSKIIISNKTHAAKIFQAKNSLEEALLKMKTDYVDIYFMHEIDSLKSLSGRAEAFMQLLKYKEKGLIKAVGASTHSIDLLEKIVDLEKIEVIMTNFNMVGLHMDGSIKDYSRALETAYDSGRGVLVMKAFAEGRLKNKLGEALKFVLETPFIHSVLIGINTACELEEISKTAKNLTKKP